MEEEYHNGEGLTMADLGLSLEELAGQPLELFAREGAKMILTVALEEEVRGFWSADAMSASVRAKPMAIAMVTGSAS